MPQLTRILTQLGYYYSTGKGTWGRFDGTKYEAWHLCEEHAQAVLTDCAELDMVADAEVIESDRVCAKCLANGR
jgi:hypothetical protein